MLPPSVRCMYKSPAGWKIFRQCGLWQGSCPSVLNIVFGVTVSFPLQVTRNCSHLTRLRYQMFLVHASKFGILTKSYKVLSRDLCFLFHWTISSLSAGFQGQRETSLHDWRLLVATSLKIRLWETSTFPNALRLGHKSNSFNRLIAINCFE